jgi:hypothetical protein
MYDTLQLVPVSVIEQDLRLHATKNQLAIVLEELREQIWEELSTEGLLEILAEVDRE